MNVTVELINASGDSFVPSKKEVSDWANAVMDIINSNKKLGELSIRVVDEEESSFLNKTYRFKDGATNILSFPATETSIEEINLLGDLAICAPVLRAEAEAQNKTLAAHWAHMIVHGVLHLNGFNHDKRMEAEKMEAQEIEILKKLGFDDPYH